MSEDEAMFERQMAEAAAEGHVGARIEMGLEAPGQVRLTKTPFRTSFKVRVQAAVMNSISLELESNQPEGTIVVLEIGTDLMELDKEIRVVLDGTEVDQTTSLELLIDAKSQGLAQPKVYLVKTEDSLKLSIYVPGFSIKTLTVEAVEAPEGPAEGDLFASSTIWIVVGIAAVIIIVGAIAAIRRRK
jgi:HSP20 family molecular chaperone IbpA